MSRAEHRVGPPTPDERQALSVILRDGTLDEPGAARMICWLIAKRLIVETGEAGGMCFYALTDKALAMGITWAA